ncbi:FtsW/RodA/SpoVE family cell cycle protein [Pedobacter immunditicola]|uniref:FtsW/RodA/SpoVE family cell cycle protein n=1 Tax=Pedobacter immunditicola TaxID=3133440 RepID=UPI0030AA4C21
MEQEQLSKYQSGNGIRRKERLFIGLLSVVLLLFFFNLFGVLQDRLAGTDKQLANGSIINLNGPDPINDIRRVLTTGNYDLDRRDVAYIGSVLENRLQSGEEFENIGELNKRAYYVPAEQAYVNGGQSFKKRALLSRTLLGYDDENGINYQQEKSNPKAHPAITDLQAGEYQISGELLDEGKAIPGVLVMLQMIIPKDSTHLQPLTAFTRTGADGRFEFKNLASDRAYEVLPLRPGFEFGRTQGIAELKGDKEFTFNQQVHSMRLLSSRDFSTLKSDGAFIVRTPDQFFQAFYTIAGGFIGAFLLLHLLLCWRAPEADQFLLPIIMVLTGLSLLTLLSLQDPLRDRFLALDTLFFLGIGVLIVCILLFINFRFFNADAKLYRMFIFRKDRSAANGWPWIVFAMLLLLSTIVLGSGPEGSGVKVNLLGVQPSEVVKFMVILFLAGFFALNERFIAEYSSWQKRWAFFSFALVAIVLTLMLFLALGDLGPAIVICFTFIILFSFSRGDFMKMAAFVGLYVLASFFIDNVWLAAAITFALLFAWQFFRWKQASESAIMALVVITAFLTIDKIPFLDQIVPGPIERLADRKAIWQDAWNNEVYGGDQVANGLWAISSGGFSGQGTGEGFAKTIPEAHTDMILPAMGEEFGWAGMVCIFVLFLIYLHRSILIGRQTGNPFLFYLCSGIGIATFIQFLLIAAGSTGALPLSGVSLPFESYGGSSLVINLAAAGFLLSVSKLRGTAVQLEYIQKQQDSNLVPALAVATAGILLLVVNIGIYALYNDKWIAKPSLVADRSGLRMFSYNPRIGILMRRLESGNLYDRGGRLLATSDPKLVIKQKKLLQQAGVGSYNLDSVLQKRPKRFYPFEEEMFFWTGDANTGIFTGGMNGYFAEYEHAAELRGFQMPISNFNVTASRYREDRFLPRGVREMPVQHRDFSALTSLLLSGLDTAQIAALKRKNRDVKLTVDASLQTQLQQSIAADTALLKSRVSVVVMESSTGDVLASAAYPLPEVNSWEQMNLSNAEQNRLPGWVTNADPGFTIATQPGSIAKLLTALAAFNKMGHQAVNKTFQVSAHERIRTKGIEPDETGRITMQRAIVRSNNVYFIKLANEEQLQEEMGSLYLKTGMFLHGVGGYYYNRPPVNKKQEEKWFDLWRKTEFNSRYNPNNIRKYRATGLSGIAWGQGELIATPASVARLAAGIANKGNLVPHRYALQISGKPVALKKGVDIAKHPDYAETLRTFMIEQSANKEWILKAQVAGKTGTPERVWKGEQINDGWYVFFAPKPDGVGNTVVCVRIESTKGSSVAVRLAGKHVIPLLVQKGYMKGVK